LGEERQIESDETASPAGEAAGGTPSDEDVVARVRGGEVALFEVLMRRHNRRLYRAARAILRDASEAEDVMQQAYLNAFLHLGQFEGRARFSTWLTRIAVHEALARRRRRAVEDQAMSSDRDLRHAAARRPDPEHQAHAEELRRLLEAAVDALPVRYRCVFVLREVEGLGTAEVAECLGVSEDVVRTRLHRAKHRLRDGLYQSVGAAGPEAFEFHLTRCDCVVAGVFERLARLAPRADGTPPA
jgi:RNA polymerase sigma-70 factor (ECF subfamily)